MTYEEVKSLLKSVKAKKSRLAAIQRYIEQERALMQGAGSLDFSAPTVKTSADNRVEKWYANQLSRIQKWERIFNDLFVEMCKEEDELAVAMQSLTSQEYEVILNRYLMGYSRKKTADIMGYSEDGIKKIQIRAIKKMSKK